MNTNIELILKLVQIVFYMGGLIIGVLTYRRAKSTILNTVNTEYHKKVIERLSEVSETLYKEFDDSSESVWYKQKDIEKVIDAFHESVKKFKDDILVEGVKAIQGYPVSKAQQHCHSLAKKYSSDPFLPEAIREKLVAFLEKRSSAMFNAYMQVLESYAKGLAKGKYWDSIEENKGWLNNKIVDRLNKQDAGITHVESEVHEIRLEIQKYFKRFAPVH